ncbi:MAG: hypothetical protein K6F15_07615 [Treponema sp.]|nr:hypothetical protein [Treponema sp.]
MKFKKVFASFILVSLIFSSGGSLFAESSTKNTAEPYKAEEFPGWMHDLRRAEIITLGAMPFVTFNISLGYSFASYAMHGFDSNYFVNPFANSSDSNAYTTDEQMAIIITSLAISTGIGLTDFIVHAAKRNSAFRKKKIKQNGPIKINPIKEDPEAVKIPITNEKNDETIYNSTVDIPNDEEVIPAGKK